MNRQFGAGGRVRRSGFTLWEFVVSMIVIVVLLALLLPAIQSAREWTRRMNCIGNMKILGLSVHNYATANRVFPPGTICANAPIQPSDQYDVWAEAGQAGAGFHGSGFLAQRILPYLGIPDGYQWDFTHGICNTATRNALGVPSDKPYSNCLLARYDVKGLYCISRRNNLRPGDTAMMLSTTWRGGGTDYGGCAGRHAAFTLQTGYNLCDATMYYQPNFFPAPFKSQADDTPAKRWGIFGRVNKSTKFGDITDGMSNTIMTGELQRITAITPDEQGRLGDRRPGNAVHHRRR